MAPLSVLLALMLAQAHPGTSIISGQQGQSLSGSRSLDKDSQVSGALGWAGTR